MVFVRSVISIFLSIVGAVINKPINCLKLLLAKENRKSLLIITILFLLGGFCFYKYITFNLPMDQKADFEYGQSNFDKSQKLLQKLQVSMPDDKNIDFDIAVCQYRMGRFLNAYKKFGNIASNDILSKAQANSALSMFAHAMSVLESDPKLQKTDVLQKGIDFFETALIIFRRLVGVNHKKDEEITEKILEILRRRLKELKDQEQSKQDGENDDKKENNSNPDGRNDGTKGSNGLPPQSKQDGGRDQADNSSGESGDQQQQSGGGSKNQNSGSSGEQQSREGEQRNQGGQNPMESSSGQQSSGSESTGPMENAGQQSQPSSPGKQGRSNSSGRGGGDSSSSASQREQASSGQSSSEKSQQVSERDQHSQNSESMEKGRESGNGQSTSKDMGQQGSQSGSSGMDQQGRSEREASELGQQTGESKLPDRSTKQALGEKGGGLSNGQESGSSLAEQGQREQSRGKESAKLRGQDGNSKEMGRQSGEELSTQAKNGSSESLQQRGQGGVSGEEQQTMGGQQQSKTMEEQNTQSSVQQQSGQGSAGMDPESSQESEDRSLERGSGELPERGESAPIFGEPSKSRQAEIQKTIQQAMEQGQESELQTQEPWAEKSGAISSSATGLPEGPDQELGDDKGKKKTMVVTKQSKSLKEKSIENLLMSISSKDAKLSEGKIKYMVTSPNNRSGRW